VGSYPTSVAVADANGDGILDLVVANSGDNTVGVLLGNGDDTFRAPQVFSANSAPSQALLAAISPSSVAVADVNGDGKLDRVVANYTGNTISVLLGRDDGSSTPSTPLTAVGLRATPLLADLDGDHTPDSVVLDRRGRILFRRGLGPAGTFDPPAVLNDWKASGEDRPVRDLALVRTGSGWEVAAADAGPDPLLSKQAGHPVYTVSLYSVAPGGAVRRTTALATDLLPERLAAANLNGDPDGLGDLVVANSLDNSVAVAFQVAPGQFGTALTGPLTGSRGPSLVVPVGLEPSDITFTGRTDADGIKRFDIAVTDQVSGDVAVLLNDAGHPFATQHRFRAGTGPYDLATPPTGPALDSRSQPVALASGAFTGPGHTDLVVVNRGDHRLAVLPGNGHGGFGNPQAALTTSTSEFDANGQPVVPHQPGPVVAGDFNGDGLTDLAVLMEDRGEVWVYTNKGFDSTGRLVLAHSHQSLPVGTLPTGLSLAPGTGNGPYDLLVGNQFGDVLTLVGQADGSFRPLFLGQDVPFVTPDLNGDGVLDVVLANQSADVVLAQIRNAGTSTFTAEEVSHASDGLKSPGGLALGDLNGDGLPDLAVADSGGNDVKVYLGTGPGHFSSNPLSFFVGDSPVGVTIASLPGPGGRPQ
jgi:hypothetical protein